MTRLGKGRALLIDKAGPEAMRWNERGGWRSEAGAVEEVTRTGCALSERERDVRCGNGGEGFEGSGCGGKVSWGVGGDE